MNLNDLLLKQSIDPRQVLVLRHSPFEPELRKVLPWLAAEKPDIFNAYQQAQRQTVERALQGLARIGYVASLIGHEAGRAMFIGLYSVGESKQITRKQYSEIPANTELKKLGMKGFDEGDPRSLCLWFSLERVDFHTEWKGKMIVGWPGLERSWWRWAYRNEFPILAILEESALEGSMPKWDEIELSWEGLAFLPTRWKHALMEWRGIYYIFDTSDGKGYVGSAYGRDNILGRWQSYAARGDGGNILLRQRNPHNFKFTILQRVSPDWESRDVIRIENSWKQRLHTRTPFGLNEN